MKKIILLLSLFLLITMTGCELLPSNNVVPIGNIQISDEKIPQNPSPINVNSPESLMDVSLNLFKSIDTSSENTLISPMSISIALAMTANGADNESMQHFNKFFGVEDIEKINNRMSTIVAGIQSDKSNGILNIANSIWYNTNTNLKIKEDFLTKSKNIYNAEISGVNFSENAKSVEKINNWVKENTDDMIKEIIKPTSITKETQMILINSLLFDYKWQEQYDKSQVIKDDFKGQDKTNEVEFLSSTERSYMETKDIIGIQKHYKGGRYSFVGMMPKKNIKISNFIKELTADDITALLNSETNSKTSVKIPKFTYDYNTSLKDSLINLGLESEFDRELADFNKMYDLTDTDKNIYINDVVHKTHIELSESGTKAAAVTAVIMATNDSIDMEKPKNVTFDRPFVYMIYDKETQLPVFMGAIINLK